MEVLMKNAFKFFGTIVMVTVIAFSMTACSMDPGDDGVPKTLVITGIPDTDGTGANAVTLKGKTLTVAICDSDRRGNPQIVALDQTTSQSTVTSLLLSGNENKKGGSFTGTGEYYIFLFFDVSNPSSLTDDLTYVYSAGSQIARKYSIKADKSTIDFNQFMKTTD
jgi:hypothetical protein